MRTYRSKVYCDVFSSATLGLKSSITFFALKSTANLLSSVNVTSTLPPSANSQNSIILDNGFLISSSMILCNGLAPSFASKPFLTR